MTQAVSRLLAEALQLSDEERGELAAKLLESIDEGADDDAEAAWGTELRRRLDELDQGKTQAVPWSEARRAILDDADEPAQP
jgi:putative addiction module component (TIGR02574 family)